MNKEELSKTISLLMHQNLYVVNNGTKEKPDFVVGGTELLNKELTKLFSLYVVVSSFLIKQAEIRNTPVDELYLRLDNDKKEIDLHYDEDNEGHLKYMDSYK